MRLLCLTMVLVCLPAIAQMAELKDVPLTPGVTRDAGRLSIQTEMSGAVTFVDSGEQRVKHAYGGRYTGIPFHVVHYTYGFEGHGSLVVSAIDGEKYNFADAPVASPDSRLLLAVWGAECCGANGVWLSAVEPPKLRTLVAYEPQGYELYSFVGWIKDGATWSVSLEKFIHAPRGRCETAFMRVPVLLKNEAGAWRFNPDDKSGRCVRE